MTISYKWLSEYLPYSVTPERLSRILTSIGLEVESLVKYEEITGGLEGLIIGEVLTTAKHPNADKLTLATVNTGGAQPLSIVCGAPNVAAGQKVIVAPVGATIYPLNGEPVKMKIAKIRGAESHGMICAEDEIGLGPSHDGILVLPADAKPGTPASEYFDSYSDWIFEIGLTPNRMDAMSHWGVARDVCAYLSHHDRKGTRVKLPTANHFKADNHSLPISVQIINDKACPRYSGVSISNIQIAPSPDWLQKKLKAIGQRPINNIVDITNFIQHETGQPLHAFDADAIAGQTVIVKNLPAGTRFVTLDEKERKLDAEDLMICNKNEGMCIAGVFGGLHSGVRDATKNIFLESACFDPVTTRKTSFRHGLRTDAASRFEKGTDISATVNVLKRAAMMIKEICGGEISSDIVDVFPGADSKREVALKYHFLKKLSGKNYHPDAVKDILLNLGFEIVKEGIDEIRVAVPWHKPDIALPADIVEEVLRIDGLDNIAIPESIMITPSVDENYSKEFIREKTAGYLVGLGFNEIITNSITNAGYYSDEEKAGMVRMLNSLSAELNILRSSLMETSLEVVAHNLNHRNQSLRLFEFGKSYEKKGDAQYAEQEELCLVVSGNLAEDQWKQKGTPADLFYLKGAVGSLFKLLGIDASQAEAAESRKLNNYIAYSFKGEMIAGLGEVSKRLLAKFDIKQPVYFAALKWQALVDLAANQKAGISEILKFPSVQRDLAMTVSRDLRFSEVEKSVEKIRLRNLRRVRLFDIFESEKLGNDKKSLAVSFTFQDDEKTLTDSEIDDWMKKIMDTLEKDLGAEIRK